jgi:hypothetical protein
MSATAGQHPPVWQVAAVGLPALAVILLWTASDGGYHPVDWYPGALLLLALALAAWLGVGASRTTLAAPALVALLALGAYVAWSYVSILWAATPGDALTGSNRALAYLLAFALCVRLDWSARRLRLALAAYVAGIGAIAVATLAQLAAGPAPQLLLNGQLAAPLGYHNGTAALGSFAALTAIALGCRRDQAILLRAALGAVATAGLELALLAQSRGWLYTLPIAAAVLVALSPSRMRTAAWAAIPAVAALLTLPWILRGYAAADGIGGTPTANAVARADVASARAALVAVLLGAVAAAALAHADRRGALARRRVGLRRAATVVAATLAAALATGGGLLVSSGAAASELDRMRLGERPRPGTPRMLQLGTGRFDYWRVALGRVARRPLTGLGQDNFAQAYLVARRTNEEPAWVHSLGLRLLAHTGAIGLILFATFLGAALLAALAAARAGGPVAHAVIGAALTPAVVWTIHGSVDWFWELPALSVPVFCLLGAAAAMAPARASPSAAHAGALSRVAGPTALAAVATVALAPAALGESALADARAQAAERPAAALLAVGRASRLQPLSAAPATLGAALELRAGRPAAARRWLAEALARDRHSWLAWLELGVSESALRRPAAAHAALRRAAQLDPREPVIAVARRRVSSRRPLTISEAVRRFRARVATRLGQR